MSAPRVFFVWHFTATNSLASTYSNVRPMSARTWPPRPRLDARPCGHWTYIETSPRTPMSARTWADMGGRVQAVFRPSRAASARGACAQDRAIRRTSYAGLRRAARKEQVRSPRTFGQTQAGLQRSFTSTGVLAFAAASSLCTCQRTGKNTVHYPIGSPQSSGASPPTRSPRAVATRRLWSSWCRSAVKRAGGGSGRGGGLSWGHDAGCG